MFRKRQSSHEGGKGGYRSRFTENKTALSQFTKNITLAFHASRKIKENILENHGSRRLWKSRFTKKKKEPFHISREIKRGRSRVTKIPFTTLSHGWFDLSLSASISWNTVFFFNFLIALISLIINNTYIKTKTF